MGDASDILPPSEIEAIEARDKAYGEGETEPSQDIAIDRAKLLRHLRALTAPADGEALGRELYEAIAAEEVAFMAKRGIARSTEPWASLPETMRGMYSRAAQPLHAIGHTAGALSREGEIAALRSEIARWQSMIGADTPEEAHRAGSDKLRELNILIDDLTGQDGAALSVAAAIKAAREDGARAATAESDALEERMEEEIAGRDATIASLTREIAAATERAEIAREMADKCAASEKATLSSWLRAKEEAEATARADGAREERERIEKSSARACTALGTSSASAPR